jgi:hypothetical protein
METNTTGISVQWLPDDDTYALRTAKSGVDKAAEQFEQEKARLYRQDGTPKYSPKEHQERLAALLEPVNKAAEKAKQTAQAVHQRCDQEATVQNTDPLLRLTKPEEQAEVTYKQVLIEDDVQKTPLTALAQRLEAIAIHGTKVEQLLYARYARRRVEEARRQAANSNRSPEGIGLAFRAVEALEQKNADPALQAQLIIGGVEKANNNKTLLEDPAWFAANLSEAEQVAIQQFINLAEKAGLTWAA